MNAAAYGLLALLGRYWFAALALFILYRLILSVTQEYRIQRQVQRQIGKAGRVGELVLLSDEERRLKPGKRYPLEGEALLGRSGQCDIRIRHRSLQPRHVLMRCSPSGLALFPVGGAPVVADGALVRGEGFASPGSTLQCGGLLFRVEIKEEAWQNV